MSQVIHNLANARADSMAGDTDSQKAKHHKKFLCCKKSSAAKKKKVLFGLVVHYSHKGGNGLDLVANGEFLILSTH